VAARFPLYTDADVHGPLVKALKRAGWDVVRAIDELPEGEEDPPHFERAVELCVTTLQQRGKIIVLGIGKSGNIGRKIAAPLTSTGSTSVVLNSVDALHGDLGILSDGDVIQSLAMTLAIRVRMLETPPETSRRLVLELLESAFQAAQSARAYAAGRA